MNHLLRNILIIVVVLAIIGGAYWYFIMRPATLVPGAMPDQNGGGFAPFGRAPSGGSGTSTPASNQNPAENPPLQTDNKPIPALRLLSNTPVGGYGASTTASTTVVRWVDRGRGNIFEARGNSLDILTLSNTVLPRVFESAWNKNLTAFIGSLMDASGNISSAYAELKPRPPQIASTSTPPSDALPATDFELKGRNLPSNIIAYASSPKKDRVFLLVNESGYGIGYVANFDGSAPKRIFDTPLTKVNVEWPEENTITVTTKGSANEGGFLYFVDPKSGTWKKIFGPVPGLSTRTSHDAKYVFLSITGSNSNVVSSIYSVSAKKGTDAIIRTLADKCVWGNFYKNMVYCGVPSSSVTGTYPDDWYTGRLSTVDKIWQVNATTNEVHLISSIVDTSDRVIDAFNLGLDPRDDFLFFMNKNDLSLWSLDLVSSP